MGQTGQATTNVGPTCDAVWITEAMDHARGTRCGRPARFVILFGGLTLSVCPWHRRLLLRRLEQKRTPFRVEEPHPPLKMKADAH